MKIALIICGILMSLAVTGRAEVCGLLEIANGDLLEVRSGKLQTMDEVFVADLVPGTKKVMLSIDSGAVTIEKTVNKLKRKVIQFTYQPLNGKKVSLSKDLKSGLGFFDIQSNSFVFIDLIEKWVERAPIPEGSKKLKFNISWEEFFSRDRCH